MEKCANLGNQTVPMSFRLAPILALSITFVTTASRADSEAKGSPSGTPFDPFVEAEKATDLKIQDSNLAHEFLDPAIITRVTEMVRPAIVTVHQIGRDGDTRGTGSGFVIAKEGLVVTNLHVIGEGQPLQVEFSDGTKRKVSEIYASDRHFDLAVLRISPGKKDYPALVVGDSDTAKQGDVILGFGAPRGLVSSVVPGAISAIRKLEEGFVKEGETPEFPMLQLAMPIEQGNSGGPVVNVKGEVIGIVTLRHRVTENLGFAVPASHLRKLLEKPNPVPMTRWSTIGTLDPRLWTAVMGAEWTQRGGVIVGHRAGEGFGGRALCLSALDLPAEPYEVSVQVKLGNEGDAAGLAFAADGGEKHYGFYPTDGKVRLGRFEGPDVYSWTVLGQSETDAYHRGEWNRLRVRVEGKKILAWINEEKVFEVEDAAMRGGKVGLCKFRKTDAEFRDFRVGVDLQEKNLTEKEQRDLSDVLKRFDKEGSSEEVIGSLEQNGDKSRHYIDAEVGGLEQRIERLRRLEALIHRVDVEKQMLEVLSKKSEEVDLFEVGLQIARIDDPNLDLDHYRAIFAFLVKDADAWIRKTVSDGTPRKKAEALRDFLFRESGFHGSRGEYYHHANSYVNHVLDDREGLPITLGVIFVELARRLSVPGVYGVALPGKFMVGWKPQKGDSAAPVLFDVFEGGTSFTREEVAQVVLKLTGNSPEESAFSPAEPREIAVRMLRNLVDLEVNRKQTPEQAVDYLELLLAIQPDAGYERFQRAILRVQVADYEGARQDMDWLLKNRTLNLDYSRLEEFRASLENRK